MACNVVFCLRDLDSLSGFPRDSEDRLRTCRILVCSGLHRIAPPKRRSTTISMLALSAKGIRGIGVVAKLRTMRNKLRNLCLPMCCTCFGRTRLDVSQHSVRQT